MFGENKQTSIREINLYEGQMSEAADRDEMGMQSVPDFLLTLNVIVLVFNVYVGIK